MHTSAYVSICQHMSAYVSIRQHTSAYVSIRQHTSAYVSIRQHSSRLKDMRSKKGASACVAATLPKHSARRSAHAAKHLTRRLLCCHELLSIRILMDNNSATILLHTGLDHSIVYKWVVHDTTVASSTLIILHYTCVVHDLQCLELHVLSAFKRIILY